MNRTLVAIAALLSLGVATPQAHAQAQTQAQQPVAAASLTTRGSVSGSITQTANNSGGPVPGVQTLDVGSAVGLSGAAGNVITFGTLVGSVTQTQLAGSTDAPSVQAVRLGSVQGSIQAGTVATNSQVLGNITQSMQGPQGGNFDVGRQLVDAGSIRNSNGGLLETFSVVDGNLVQSQARLMNQEVRVGSIDGALVQGARAGGSVFGTITQNGGTGTAGGGLGQQTLTVGAIDGVHAQSVQASGLLAGSTSQTQSGSAQQGIDIGTVRSANAAVAGHIRTRGVATSVVQSAAGQESQFVSVARVLGSSANSANANGTISRTVTQTSSGGTGGGVQLVEVGSIAFAGGNVETDAVVDATVTQVRTGPGDGAPVQNVAIGTARGTTGVVRTRARVNGSITQVATAARGVEQTIEIGTVRGGGANVSTDASFSGNLVQANSGAAEQQQLIRIGSVTPGN